MLQSIQSVSVLGPKRLWAYYSLVLTYSCAYVRSTSRALIRHGLRQLGQPAAYSSRVGVSYVVNKPTISLHVYEYHYRFRTIRSQKIRDWPKTLFRNC